MRIECPELGFLAHRTLHLSILLTTGGRQIFPGQNLPMDEEVIVEDASRGGKEEWLFFRFVLGGLQSALYQKRVARRNCGLRLPRTSVPSIRISLIHRSEKSAVRNSVPLCRHQHRF